MTLEQQLQYCRICENRKMNPAIGLVCGLTDQKPAFENQCPTFRIDQPEADRLLAIEQRAKEEEQTANGSFAPEKAGIKKGLMGGVIMLLIAIVWFVVGLAAGYVFYYPPILAIIGIYAIIKGLAKGNYTGEK